MPLSKRFEDLKSELKTAKSRYLPQTSSSSSSASPNMPPPIPPRKPSHLASAPPPIPGNKPSAAPAIPACSPAAPSSPIKKRCLAWDWTSTRDKIPMLPFLAPSPTTGQNYICSVHNWNSWAPPEYEQKVPFRPMVRVAASLEGNDWAMAADNPHEVIHFLNEPERFQPPMTPEAAAAAWTSQMLPLRQNSSKKLVSPCVASDPQGTAWLTTFMSILSQNPSSLPDYLGLHYYSPSAPSAIAYLSEMHARWPTLPVMVTEIACISRDEREVVAFTRELANWMDSTDWIVEYAFFGCMKDVADGFVSPVAQLMDKEGKPTKLGEMLMWEQPVKGYL